MEIDNKPKLIPKPIEIRVGRNGGFRVVDVDAFFEQPKVKAQLEAMKDLDLTKKGEISR